MKKFIFAMLFGLFCISAPMTYAAPADKDIGIEQVEITDVSVDVPGTAFEMTATEFVFAERQTDEIGYSYVAVAELPGVKVTTERPPHYSSINSYSNIKDLGTFPKQLVKKVEVQRNCATGNWC